jgi:hypothetical protein
MASPAPSANHELESNLFAGAEACAKARAGTRTVAANAATYNDSLLLRDIRTCSFQGRAIK